MSLQGLMQEISEQTIVDRVTRPIDQATLKFQLSSTTVRDEREFEAVIGDFVKYIFRECIAPGAEMPDFEAVSRGKQMLANAVRRRRQTLMNVLANALDGLNGGMLAVIRDLAEGLKNESIEHYLDDVFDRHVPMGSWEEKVATIKALMDRYEDILPDAIRAQPPERYAANFKEFLRSLWEMMRETGADFRKV